MYGVLTPVLCTDPCTVCWPLYCVLTPVLCADPCIVCYPLYSVLTPVLCADQCTVCWPLYCVHCQYYSYLNNQFKYEFIYPAQDLKNTISPLEKRKAIWLIFISNKVQEWFRKEQLWRETAPESIPLVHITFVEAPVVVVYKTNAHLDINKCKQSEVFFYSRLNELVRFTFLPLMLQLKEHELF